MRSVGHRVPFFVRIFVRIFVGGILSLAASRSVFADAPLAPTADAALTLAPAANGVEVHAGATVVAGVPLTTPPLRRGAATLREVDVEGHRVVEVRVPVRGSSRAEVWLGELRSGGTRVVWSGFSGPRDADAETGLGVDLSSEGVVQYQTASLVSRCDGAPARLFPRAFDFATGKFRAVRSTLPAPAAVTLTARRGDSGMPVGRSLGAFHFTGASTTLGAGDDARSLGAPTALDDGDVATAWAEGLGGDGRGEWLTARAASSGTAVRGLRFVPGDASSAASFRARNRVRRFQLALGPKADQRFDVVVPEDSAADAAHFREPYWVALPHPVVASCATVILTEVTPGTEAAPPKTFGTTAMSELTIFTDLDGPDAVARLVADIVRSADCATRVSALVSVGPAALSPVAQALMTSGARGARRECLVEALSRLDPDGKNALATEAFTTALGGATEKEERLVTAMLRKSASPPVGAVEKLLVTEAVPAADRARAARVLGALDDAHAALALLAAAGSGTPELRLAVVSALGASSSLAPAALFAAIEGARGQSGSRQGDLLRVVPAVVRRAPTTSSTALGILRAAATAERPFEVRARAVVALGGLGESGLDDVVALARHADEPVLRHLAARELAGRGGASSLAALRGALGDGDPRVRETAAQGLGQDRDGGAAAALVAGAKQEPWPFVRRAELEALGTICAPGTGDLFARAVERDVEEVRRAALVGLARCKDARARDTLLHALGRRNEASTLRALAAGLLGELGDHAAAAPMAAALERQVSESEEDLSVEGVAGATLRALAHLGGPEATRVAVSLANDTHHPFRRDAVEALGTLCDAGAGAATLRTLEAGSDSQLAAAAQAAHRRCASRP